MTADPRILPSTDSDAAAARADGGDMRFIYRLFLGREAGDAASQTTGTVAGAVADILRSPEFLVEVRDAILRTVAPAGGRFAGKPDAGLKAWIIRRLPLAAAGRSAVPTVEHWSDLLALIFADQTFLDAMGTAAVALRPPIVQHLVNWRDPQAPPRSNRLDWLIVTGPPRSGTTLLHAMLCDHPQVALLIEYGLDTLVERIDALIARPALQRPDWSRGENTGDRRFADTAGFFEHRAGNETNDPSRGELRGSAFDAIAAATFATLAPDKTLRVVGDKLPMTEGFPDVGALTARLPGLKIVAIIRDPADVVRSSLIRREATRRGIDLWPIMTVQEAIGQWVFAWRQIRRLQTAYPDRVCLMRYEDLCADPAPAMAGLWHFLDLPVVEPRTAVSVRPAQLVLHGADEEATIRCLAGAISDRWRTSPIDEVYAHCDMLRSPYVFGRRIALPEGGCGVTINAEPMPDGGFTPAATHTMVSIRHGETSGTLLIKLWIVPQNADPAPDDLVVRIGGATTIHAMTGSTTVIPLVADAEEAIVPGTLDLILGWLASSDGAVGGNSLAGVSARFDAIQVDRWVPPTAATPETRFAAGIDQ